ncbi:hypothetical protein AVEN_44506-1 [Araneus ventricosus]|uniref:Uncharacterized protein n=1 Tax=Araneus ventricosus TaxID=182803 RepID=A0A4Y2UEH7_ARAVE|nr:hypothetical protein AVEN_44506-1 [Araneus ventricosus]
MFTAYPKQMSSHRQTILPLATKSWRCKAERNGSTPFRVSFLPSTRGINVVRPFDLTATLARSPKLESTHEVLDFEFVGIPASPSRYANLHRFLKLAIAFSFPCSKNSILDYM